MSKTGQENSDLKCVNVNKAESVPDGCQKGLNHLYRLLNIEWRPNSL